MSARGLLLALSCGVMWSLAACATAPTPAPGSPKVAAPAPEKDRLDIREVNFLKASAPGFIVFSVSVDYALVSSAEGNVALAMDLTPGTYTLMTEQRVKRGRGSVELLAECKRSERSMQGINVSLTEYPGGLPRKTLESQIRAVALPPSP